RRRRDGPRVGIAQHRQGNRRARSLEQIHVGGGSWGRIEAIFANVAHDAYDGEQTQIAIHVSKFDGVADGVLIGPAFARQRFADHGDVGSIRAVALVEDAPSNQGNSENLEVSVRSDAEIRTADAFFLPHERAKAIHRFRNLVLRHQEKHSVGKAAVYHWQIASGAHLTDAGDLLEAVNQA